MSDEEPRVFQPGDGFRQYEVEAFLGAGVSGQVYSVRHKFTGDRFALKVAHLADRGDAKKAARALQDGRAGHALRHANVARVYDLACEDDGMVWQLMELLQGNTVAELLGRSGRLSPLYAIDIALEVAFGLQAAHEQGIIHRDVQPSNVFITRAGVVKLIDFSLAKILGLGIKTTRRDGAKGSTAYMSPEHLAARPPTPQFDVYALGLMLWQMLTGRHPFAHALRNTMALVHCQHHEDPAPLAEVVGLPAYCDEVIRGATAKDPSRRHAGMWSVVQALLDLRARLAADPAVAALVADPPVWERDLPIARTPEVHSLYRAPAALPAAPPPPVAPAERVVVPQPMEPVVAAPAWRPVAATVPMAAFTGPVAQPALPVEAPPVSRAPVSMPATERARPPRRPRRAWLLFLILPLLGAAAVGGWLILSPEGGHEPSRPPPAARTKR